MIKKTVQEIARMAGGELIGCDDPAAFVCGVSIDSRTLNEHTLYIPMIGAHVDGHQFVEQVPGVSLWQRDHTPLPAHRPLILVNDTEKALQALAASYMDTLSCKVIGITGSNGKTGTKDIFCSVFAQAKKTQKTQGNRNNELGVPLTILELDEDCEIAVIEMGVENPGDIDFLATMVRPDIAVITNIGSAHMENLGSKMGIARAKCEILKNLKPGGLFLYNSDSPEIAGVMADMEIDPSKRIVSFGTDGMISLTSPVETRKNGISFTCSALQERVFMNTLGTFQAFNALPAIYAAKDAGLSETQILYGLSHLEMTKMRTQLIEVGKAVILDDTYKSNPESAQAAIDTLMTLPTAKHYAFLSDMLDLGDNEKRLHEIIGEYALEKGLNGVYCVGERSQATAEAAGKIGHWYASKEAAVNDLLPLLDTDCALLVKGSRAMKMDEAVQMLREVEV